MHCCRRSCRSRLRRNSPTSNTTRHTSSRTPTPSGDSSASTSLSRSGKQSRTVTSRTKTSQRAGGSSTISRPSSERCVSPFLCRQRPNLDRDETQTGKDASHRVQDARPDQRVQAWPSDDQGSRLAPRKAQKDHLVLVYSQSVPPLSR